jgi:hypothetical protein
VFSAQSNPYNVFLYRCADIKCTTGQATHFDRVNATSVAANQELSLSAAEDPDTVTASIDVDWVEASADPDSVEGDASAAPLSATLAFMPQSRTLISASGAPLIVSTTAGGTMFLYRCNSDHTCRTDSTASLLAYRVSPPSIDIAMDLLGHPVIAYIHTVYLHPVIVTCLDIQCTSVTEAHVQGIRARVADRVSLHLTAAGVMAFTVPGAWRGAAVNDKSFVSAATSEAASQAAYTQLQQQHVLSSKGVVDAAFDPLTTDISWLYEDEPDAHKRATMLEETRNVLDMMRGQPAVDPNTGAPNTNTNERQVLVVHCWRGAASAVCGSGYAHVSLPWAGSANVTDVVATVNARGESLFFALHQTVSERWGTRSALSTFTCPAAGCQNGPSPVGGGKDPHAVLSDLASNTGRIAARAHPHSASNSLVMVDVDSVPRTARCSDDQCSSVSPANSAAATAVCEHVQCFDMVISPVDGLPVQVGGSRPVVSHCSNPFCMPYVSY